MKKTIISLSIIFSSIIIADAQQTCYTASNTISFTHGTHSYKIIKELKNWSNAVTCAVSDGGYLVTVNDSLENAVIFNHLMSSSIPLNYHPVNDGGGASYVWIGASDEATEGYWHFRDFTGLSDGYLFWYGEGQVGNDNGFASWGTYNNWGSFNGIFIEPDNYLNNQDAAAIGLTGWPYGVNSYGSAGQWNDINKVNTLFYIIEYDTQATGLLDNDKKNSVVLYPNPTKDLITIETNLLIKEIKLICADGKIIKPKYFNRVMDISNLSNGIYMLDITTLDNQMIKQKIIKE